jgi:hypothetical protein
MNKIYITGLVLLLLHSPLQSTAKENDNLLTGDTRLACEAILCLSSPANPTECTPSLDRYFGITRKKASDTRKARRSFLNLCPSAKADDDMVSLTSSIAYAAGRCNANNLNGIGQWMEERRDLPAQDCRNNQNIYTPTHSIDYQLYSNEYSSVCVSTVRYWQVNTKAPGYCTDLWEHNYTDFSQRPHIVLGENPWDTRWVD